MDLKSLLSDLAPTLATALGGPLAGAAVAFLAKKLNLDEESLEAVQNAVAGMKAADLIKLKELDYDFQKFVLDNSLKIDLAQINVNNTEAGSQNWFVSGWRPAAGWTCVAGLFYASILEPILRFVATVVFKYAGVFPVLDTFTLVQILLGMLGLGAMRMREKEKGVANK